MVLSAVAAARDDGWAANAAEIYNKDGNKLDLYGRSTACIIFPKPIIVRMAINLISVWVAKRRDSNYRSTNRFWTVGIRVNANRPEEDGDSSGSPQSWTRLGFAGLAFADMGVC